MIYVHVPFCRSFCTYCDFYSEVAAKCHNAEAISRQDALFGDYAEALAMEVQSRAEEISDEVNTLYIGGGTPSVLPLSAFRRILESLESVGHGGPYDEFTVEVNPEDIVEKGHAYVEGLLDMGVNRISMGVQSFDDTILRFMNRRHNAAAAVSAYRILEEAGVGNISIDLIFGLPQLGSDLWEDTIDKALNISSRGVLPQHISSYQLSVEPGSMLARLVAKGSWTEASEESCQEQYGILCDKLSAAGYIHYEISNFAIEGFEARHNSAYWKHVPYVGLGPGAHSFLNNQTRQWNKSDLNAYLKSPVDVREYETLTEDQLVLERIMLALRTSDGIDESFLRRHVSPCELKLALETGNLVRSSVPMAEESRLRIPESRFFVSDSIIADMV